MDHSLPEQLLFDLSECVAGQMGLHFPRERWRELESGIRSAARELGIDEVTSWIRSLLSTPLTKQQIEILASELTIGETYFFRDKRGFEILGEHVLPELIRARRGIAQRLRIWSAGCCTGEEAYSIAILLERILPDLSDWQVTILATDINTRFLQRAAEGVFSEWSFRDAPSWLKERYFQSIAERRYMILPRIRERVTFAYLNLAEDIYPSLAGNTNAMDLILCRNVLMYFTPERTSNVVDNFRRSLVEGGWLMVSAVENSSRIFSRFASVPFDGAVLYKKEDQPSPTFEFTAAAPEPAAGNESLEQPVATTRQESHAAGDESAPFETALMLFARGRYLEAAWYLRADEASPTLEASRLLARIYANLGDLAEARRWAEYVIAADKTNPASHYLRAVILQEQHVTEEALASLRRTLYLEPDFPLAHFALGNIVRGQGKRKEAGRHFTNALALLKRHGDNDVLPHSDGMAAGRLREMIQSIMLPDIVA
jgi:chemotaxis protein methyltransferase CheR